MAVLDFLEDDSDLEGEDRLCMTKKIVMRALLLKKTNQNFLYRTSEEWEEIAGLFKTTFLLDSEFDLSR